ncbi:MAG: tRNA lysidine(34) synthetase TilS [Capsulimonas sp.]|uniref:tRNA lysidine(34) synthetase TilS n=1 Tax=Capsulimonas sp. TaxID=2494211 RepID=UPI0032641961
MSAAMALLDTLRHTIDRHDLLRPGQSVMAAVSGGPDSLSLLHALHLLRAELQISALSAAHLDHGLRGEESAAEAAFVAAFCAERGIPCYSKTLAAGALTHSMGSGLQAAARSARYEFLQRAAAQFSADRVATAHTQDDQVETILMRILRGSGLEGLRGIPYSRANIIRPLRDTTRSEVEAYCAEHGLSPRRDPSNIDPSHYLRNKIRLELLPELETNYALGVRAALLRLSQNAAIDDAYLQSQTKASLTAIQVSASDRQTVLSRQHLMELAAALQRRTLRLALMRLRGTAQDIEERHIASFLTATLNPTIGSYSITLPAPACHLMFTQDHIILSLPESIASVNTPITLNLPSVCAFNEWTIEARLTSEQSDAEYAETLDADCVDLPTLCVRSWQSGDRMDVLGLDGKSKKLSDLFTDAKIPRAQRPSIPIVADANGPLWVVGLRIAERARTTEGTVRFLRLWARPDRPPSVCPLSDPPPAFGRPLP